MREISFRRLKITGFTSLCLMLVVICMVPVNAATKKQKISMNKSELTLQVGESFKLKLKLSKSIKKSKDSNGLTSKKLVFVSSNKKIATVNSKGRVKALKHGITKIKVHIKGQKKNKCFVKVIVKVKCKTQTSKPTSTAVPTNDPPVNPNAAATVDPKSIREYKGYVRKKANDTIVLSNGENTSTILVMPMSSIAADCKIKYQDVLVTANNIEVGDYIVVSDNVGNSGAIPAIYPTTAQKIISIDIQSKNEQVKNKIYPYKIISITEVGNLIIVDGNIVYRLEGDMSNLVYNGVSIDKSELRVGDMVRFIDADGYDCDVSMVLTTCKKVEVVSRT